MPSYAVVGASRGIGLEFVYQLACRSDTVVFAIARNPEGSTHLKTAVATFKNVHIISGDVADHSTLEASLRLSKQVSEITSGKLDYLIHNAANLDPNDVFKGFSDYPNMEDLDNDFISAVCGPASRHANQLKLISRPFPLQYKVNSLGPVHSITAFLPLLRASTTRKIIVIGSGGGYAKTILALGIVNICAYAMSKAAAHIAATKFALQLKDEGFVVVTLDPGFVNVSATAPSKDALKGFRAAMRETEVQFAVQTPKESVLDQLRVIDGLESSHNGLYLSHKGGEYQAPG
ncbi:hypothetical protein GSI_12205 [Ganoderma sinense ZZ0214-1]|uniref:Uncharacterized protein n=1 Tax=Ganoderma sinense ZZ0214-1 TaxID=1077348 RepID=A0A2G8RY88_9APHY|nr:hypothetical protein GSI_12205 [Ganoderma sinense ZZ0214-1]